MKRRKKHPVLWIIIITILLVAGIYYAGIQFYPASGNNNNTSTPGTNNTDGLIISEVVTSNQYSLTDSTGVSPDWIELYNGTGASINLSGYGLSDDSADPMQFKFPSVNITSGQYLVVFAVGKEDSKTADGIISLGFQLAQDGEKLLLSDPSEKLIQQLEVGPMPSDMSYGWTKDGNYGYFSITTPGSANSSNYNTKPEFDTSSVESVLKINEVMPKNDASVMDQSGERHEWAEIINTGTQPVNLKDYALSDNASDRKKWVFPELELAPGEMMMVFLSGKNITAGNELHANFQLSSDETSLLLSNPQGLPIDVVKWVDAPGNVSLGRDPQNMNTWLYYASPTPGEANTTKGFNEIDKNTERYLPK
ncbi:MAG: lamin tail domain-containing protein [Christensenellales bacterium]